MLLLKRKINSLYYPVTNKVVLPQILMVEPTSACNLKCSICCVQQRITERNYLTCHNFKKIIDQFPKVREIVFCGIGEPLLNLEIFDMIKVASAKGIKFINLITNGKLLNEDICKKILNSAVNRIQISVHSFNPENFAKIRNEGSDNLVKLKQNIGLLVKLRDQMNSSLKISFTSVITTFNFKEMEDFINQAKKTGADRVEFFQLTTYSGDLRDITAPSDEIPRLICAARRTARRLNMEIGFLSGNEYGRCYQMWNFIMIHANGNISPCNGIFPIENIAFGNILNEPIDKIWNSQSYMALRQSVINGKLPNCNFCEVGYCLEGKNPRWFKNYYLRPLARILKNRLFKKYK